MEITPCGLVARTPPFYWSDFPFYKSFSSTGIAGGFLFRAFRPQLAKALTKRAGNRQPFLD